MGTTRLRSNLAADEVVRAGAFPDRGVIVGSYVGHDGHTHGFAFRNGQFTTIDAPDALETFSNAINDQGEIVGGYQSRADLKFRGYVLRGDAFTTIDRPDVSLIITIGINDEGSVVGSWAGGDGARHGYVLRRGEFTSFDPPGILQPPGEKRMVTSLTASTKMGRSSGSFEGPTAGSTATC